MRFARVVHGITFVVAIAALVLQTVLVVDGSAVLDETDVPPLGLRLFRLVSYFTIQSNLLVAIVSGMLVADPARTGRLFKVIRLDAVVGIAVTGLVHWFLLRPLLDLTGASAAADTSLHIVVPLLCVVGWLLVGPRPRIDLRTAALALVWPMLWTIATLVVGEATGFYPYPFLDPEPGGYGPVLLTCAGITVLFGVLFAIAAAVDRLLPPTPGQPVGGGRRPSDPPSG